MKIDWNEIPPAAPTALLPWQQIAALVRKNDADADRVRGESYPRLILRGDRTYLRSLRASETVAWDAASKNLAPNHS